MKNWKVLAFSSILFLCLFTNIGKPCTSFCLKDNGNHIFGTNFDNDKVHEGLLFVNKRKVSKTGWEASTTGEYAGWISKYGSVTFNLVGYQLVWAGMNEEGLVVSTMALSGTQSPPPDERPPLISPFWLQYLLDNCSTVEEVIASRSRVRMGDNVDHFLVCDAIGNCAAIEFIGGKMVCHTDRTLPIRVLANNPYKESVDIWGRDSKRGFLSRLFSKPKRGASLVRFKVAADRVKKFESKKSVPAVKYAFNTLDMISGHRVAGSPTNWSIVFDIGNRRTYFRTRTNSKIRFFDLRKFDFSSSTPVKMLDIHAELSGDVVSHFVDYSREINLQHLHRFCQKYGLDVAYKQQVELTQHLDSFECVE